MFVGSLPVRRDVNNITPAYSANLAGPAGRGYGGCNPSISACRANTAHQVTISSTVSDGSLGRMISVVVGGALHLTAAIPGTLPLGARMTRSSANVGTILTPG